MSGWSGGMLALVAIFLPSFLLVLGALPFWDRLRGNATARAALGGINAGVVGLLLAALYDPVWTSAIHTLPDLILAAAALSALTRLKAPPWLVVVLTAVGGALLASPPADPACSQHCRDRQDGRKAEGVPPPPLLRHRARFA